MKVLGTLQVPLVLSTKTANYTLAIADEYTLIQVNSASPLVITVPTNASSAIRVGAQIMIFRQGAGTVTVTPSGGVTVRSNGGALELAAQYSVASLIKIGINEWILSGDII